MTVCRSSGITPKTRRCETLGSNDTLPYDSDGEVAASVSATSASAAGSAAAASAAASDAASSAAHTTARRCKNSPKSFTVGVEDSSSFDR